MKLPERDRKGLDIDTFSMLCDLIFGEKPEGDGAADKKIRDVYKILIDRGYDPTKLFSRNIPKK